MEILGTFQISVRKALKEIEPDYERLNGLVICGTHSPKSLDIEMMINKIRQARENGLPFLGLCFGHQLCAIEYARNVQGIKDATSEEFGQGTFVVKKRENLNIGHKGDTSYWNNYYVVNQNIFEANKPGHFVTTQGHPEYESSYWKPHKLLIQFINLCRTR